ncbi:GTP-binding protein [Spiromyces aspiralis]|uniref:GTP-binding protein n=1 Tax=Spiromyces aspiralis TaxID=68401 RepID=A0ACC1HLU8_9FUNG|nr:GTP-binding protein [Spiromyces aspiralis]
MLEPAPFIRVRNLVVLGARGAGKTSLVTQYAQNAFCGNYVPSIEGTYEKIVEHEGHEYRFHILDTAGQDEWSYISTRYLMGIHAFVIVYSVDFEYSFQMAKIVRNMIIDQTSMAFVRMVLVANKCDKVEDRVITREQGERLAEEFECPYFETSAKDRINIDEAFKEAVFYDMEEISKMYKARRKERRARRRAERLAAEEAERSMMESERKRTEKAKGRDSWWCTIM